MEWVHDGQQFTRELLRHLQILDHDASSLPPRLRPLHHIISKPEA